MCTYEPEHLLYMPKFTLKKKVKLSPLSRQIRMAVSEYAYITTI